ncbi:hypothetical protein [Burkholderia pseudomallei]|uniref:hypothetical protein n=1 Tax=Burkholderia pseudomallei TaxID=28450 RepID=UPI000F20F314|nr:hypothetical protein [Burkholderia pseudomallei]CAJ4869567.1 Uncharacterised protein [Burkholderia pseudomallei]CAJ5296824.1 Uncharacterised protein [Burkholderia pseudomallei]CAJ5393082.1 Uncharacterised protein [Burkholderia pseudomallei]CAJ7342477.1 Uncharacterised protein [Burkholderia pseudomallei]VBJ69333.1 Uncharacterised protein [Burkholderia pseudomallei]
MAEQKRRAGGGPKTTRSEIVTIRLEPRLRYLAELAARRQRRTLSSFIEWAIEAALAQVEIQERIGIVDEDGQPDFRFRKITVAEDAESLWDVEEADRFVKLAGRYPELLTHDEQVLWKLIFESGLWPGDFKTKLRDIIRHTDPASKQESALQFERLREHWDAFVAVAKGEKDQSALPWERTDSGGEEKVKAQAKSRRQSKATDERNTRGGE